jgi:hypothetical protein
VLWGESDLTIQEDATVRNKRLNCGASFTCRTNKLSRDFTAVRWCRYRMGIAKIDIDIDVQQWSGVR